MKAQLHSLLKSAVSQLCSEKGVVFEGDIQLTPTKTPAHGDQASNIALQLAKPMKASPRELAQAIIDALPDNDLIDRAVIAGPGFINFYWANTAIFKGIWQVLAENDSFGAQTIGENKKVLLEYVSANPTGPLHVGHGRGAAYGSSLANILKKVGYDVCQEYYVNDAGRQIKILTLSVWLRYLIMCHHPVHFPPNAYQGDYIKDIAKSLKDKVAEGLVPHRVSLFVDVDDSDKSDEALEKALDHLINVMVQVLDEQQYETVRSHTLDIVLGDIKEDLQEFGVSHDVWFSERKLEQGDALTQTKQALEKAGVLFESNGALWFRSTQFGDEKDRVFIRANGQPTYFAHDVSYHYNKYDRGFDAIIDIFGADHHGYIPRLKASMQALGHDTTDFHILLVQFANLYAGDKKLSMSTRSGSFVTLRELREDVGVDATRFFYAMRKSDAHMDFDLELAKSQSQDNPVYTIQYAHARVCSIFRQLEEKGLSFEQGDDCDLLSVLEGEKETLLMKHLLQYPEILKNSAQNYSPHLLAQYLQDLAHDFHGYYNAFPILSEGVQIRTARLCLIQAVAIVLKNGLALLGVSAPRTM